MIFSKLVKKILKPLPRNDYPSLNTFTFGSCWLEYVMAKVLNVRKNIKKSARYDIIVQKLPTQNLNSDADNFLKISQKNFETITKK